MEPVPLVAWSPPERPEWADRLNAYGDAVGGAANLISLEPGELLGTARSGTGLQDFSEDGWRVHFDAFLSALNSEADLHLLGRILARTEILRTLRNRLGLAALWEERPDVLETEVTAPVFIVGGARTGTSILFELMAADPATRAPAMWEMQHPVEAVRGEDWSATSERVETFHHWLQPEYETMHANSGHLPNECIFMTSHAFLSDVWGSQYNVPSFQIHMARADHRLAYQTHKRFLQTLQQREASQRWVLKAPSHQAQLRTLFDVYPDARVIRTHRDPLKSFPSMLDLMGTLLWMRCNRVDLEHAAKAIPANFARLFRQEIEDRKTGTLPDDQFIDVQFADLVRDPASTIHGIYERLGWEFSGPTRQAILRYAANKPKGSRGAHRYSLEDSGLESEKEAERFLFYTQHYGIPAEDA